MTFKNLKSAAQAYETSIWALVLPYLHKSRPLPLSQPPRSALTQSHLVIAMQVSREWANICRPLLYRDIVTDDLPSLLDNIDDPAAQARFAHTRSLYLEYSPKGDEGGYDRLLGPSGGEMWPAIGARKEEVATIMRDQCNAESEAIMEALLASLELNLAEIFPRLRSVAAASIYGTQSDAYTLLDDETSRTNRGGTPLSRGQVQFRLEAFLARVGVTSYCTRQPNGPLSIPPVSYASESGTGLTSACLRTQHFNLQTPRYPLPFGLPIRWSCDESPTASMSHLLIEVTTWVRQHIDQREEAKRRFGPSNDKVDLTVYCSTSTAKVKAGLGDWQYVPLTDAIQKERVTTVAAGLQKDLRKDSKLEDMVRWFPSKMTPTCTACGSGVPV